MWRFSVNLYILNSRIPLKGGEKPSYLLTFLNESRLEGKSCDVVLVMDGHELKAHKCILSAASPYFRAMFFSNIQYREASLDRVVLGNGSHTAMSTMLDFIYTSKITITDENVFDLMEDCNLFQIHSLRYWISKYLLTKFNASNCLGIYAKARMYDYQELAGTILRYMQGHFGFIIREDEFLDVSSNILSTLLSKRFLHVREEHLLLRAILKWIAHDPDERKVYVPQLFSKVRMKNIPMQKLLEIKHYPLYDLPPEVMTQLEEEIKKWQQHYSFIRGPVLTWDNVRYGSEQAIILAIGGESDGEICRTVDCYTAGFDTWKNTIPQYVYRHRGAQNLLPIPELHNPRYNSASAHDHYNVYILGGRDKERVVADCETFSTTTFTWTRMVDLPMPLEGAAAVFFQGRVVVMGGQNSRGCTNKAWEWDSNRNVWKTFPPLLEARSFHCAVVYGEYIYAIGGFGSDNETLRAVERYDSSLNIWQESRQLQRPRARFGCAVSENSLFVMGGVDRGSSLMTVEKFDTENSEWVYMSPLLVPRSSFVAAACEDRILCIGGSDNIHPLHSVDKYSPSSNRWHFLFSMQITRNSLCVAKLYVPHLTNQIPSPL